MEISGHTLDRQVAAADLEEATSMAALEASVNSIHDLLGSSSKGKAKLSAIFGNVLTGTGHRIEHIQAKARQRVAMSVAEAKAAHEGAKQMEAALDGLKTETEALTTRLRDAQQKHEDSKAAHKAEKAQWAEGKGRLDETVASLERRFAAEEAKNRAQEQVTRMRDMARRDFCCCGPHVFLFSDQHSLQLC